MANLTKNQGAVNQNYNETPAHTHSHGYYKKNKAENSRHHELGREERE